MMEDSTAVLQYRMAAEPAFQGYIESTLDALLIFEACQRGVCPRVTRRLHERERRQIGSGSVYVFDEREAGIKRWTDGRVWSPSRILQNFLVYRELDKRATPPSQSAPESGGVEGGGGGDTGGPPSGLVVAAPLDSDGQSRAAGDNAGAPDSNLSMDRNRERALVGSLTSSYRFRADGLVKKTISVSGLHMISYYKIEDVLQGRLRTPSSHPELQTLDISPGFLVNQNFRVTPQIEIGPDGRPRYRAEGEDGSTGPPGPLQPPPPRGSAMSYAFVPDPSDSSATGVPAVPRSISDSSRPSRSGSDGSNPSHHGSPASPHLALAGPGSSIPVPGSSRPGFPRGQSTAVAAGPGRSAPSISSNGRYEPYGGRPPPRSGHTSQPSYFGHQAGTGGSPGYGHGYDPLSTTMAQRGATAGWPQPRHTGPPSYYGPSPPHSATESRSFENLQQLPSYAAYRASAGSSAAAYEFSGDSNQYRSASVPPNSTSSFMASPGPSTPAALGEHRPSSTSYHAVRGPDEGAAYMSNATGPRGHYGSIAPSHAAGGVNGRSPEGGPGGGQGGFSYPGGQGGGFRPSSAASSGAYPPFAEGPGGGAGSGTSAGSGGNYRAGSGSPMLSPLDRHQALPGGIVGGSSLTGPTPRHAEEGANAGQPRRSPAPPTWASAPGPSWLPAFKQEETS